MATTTIGSNPGVNDWAFDAAMHQAWIQNYVPGTLGRMIQVAAYCAAAASGGTGGAVAWQNVTGAPLQTTSDAIGVGSGTSGAWHTTGGDIPFSAGDSWQFGFYASKGVWVVYHADGGLTQVKASAISAANGGTNISAYGAGTGSMSAYGTYFIVEIYERRSNAWTKAFMYDRRGAGWSLPPSYIWRGAGWTQVGRLAEHLPMEPDQSFIGRYRNREGIWLPCLLRWEGPFYAGPASAREFHLHGDKIWAPRPYELKRAA